MRNFPRLMYNLATSKRRLHWNKHDLRRYQEQRLRKVIKHAYESVPFYHEKFRSANISPSDIRTIEDLTRLPITKKDEVRKENPDRLVSSRFEKNKLKIMSTSGSSGKPLKVYLTSKEDDWRKAIYLRANVMCGQRLRDRWSVIIAPRHIGNTTAIQQRLRIFAQDCISVFSSIDEQIAFLNRTKPDVLDGYSGSLYLLAKRINEDGLEVHKPRLMFGSADLTDTLSRKYMEKAFGAPYHDQFGCIEVDRTAWQCTERAGYHMDIDSVITEFLDEEGCTVSPEEKGEIVFTSLFNYAMPFIRYSVGDIGRPSDETCPCGITLPLMKVVEGRKDSFIVLPDGQMVSPRMFTVAISMSSQYPNIEQFRIVQKRTDLLEIVIKKRNPKTENKMLEKEVLADLKKLLKIGQNIEFAVKFVDEIPRSKSGKFAAVISEV